MVNGKCNIGEAREKLPEPYIERCLLKNVIDAKLLENIPKKAALILDCILDENSLQKELRKHNLIKIEDFLKVENDKNLSFNVASSFKKKSHMEFSSLITTIYFTKNKCKLTEFNAVYDKLQNIEEFHQFRVRDDGNLEWIRSKGDISDIEKYKLSEYYPLQERDLSHLVTENNINVLVSDPGMGKSELMKSFKNKYFSDCFTVIINPKDVYSLLRNTPDSNNYVNVFQNFLLNEKCKMLSQRDKEIFRIFLKKNKIVFMWDALDELLEEHRDIVIDIILELSKNCLQWVTSRCHLGNMLERKFNILSLHLSKFDQEEQRNYIRERVADVREMESIETIIQKIESSFVLFEYQDILGIPLQLFMLTELLRQNRKKYLVLLNDVFLLTDLYKYFIDEQINILYKKKLSIDLNTAYAETLMQSQKDKILEEYTKAALRLLFSDTLLRQLGVQIEVNFQNIYESHTNIGLITEVKEQIPRFLHNSFAEYLAARYFGTKLEDKKVLLQVMFDPNYANVRFFFDLLLARDSKAHVSVLCRNFDFVKSCNGDILTSVDFGGRSLLHLACSWGQRYPELKVKRAAGSYIVDDKGTYTPPSDKMEYLETIDFLLVKCDISQQDELYKMTAIEYAQRAKCLAAEMRIIMHRNTGTSIKNDRIINMLYYSTYYGYYKEFEYFCQLFFPVKTERKLQQKHMRKRKSKNIVDSVKNNIGRTFLSMAATLGHKEIVEILVRAGADIDLGNEKGYTPLTSASCNGHNEIVKFLVKSGADVNITDKDGATSVISATLHGHVETVELLIKLGADLKLSHKTGETALIWACWNGHEKIIELLLKNGADVDLPHNLGMTPLATAACANQIKIVEFLVGAGADINLKDNVGDGPLSVASLTGHDDVVEFLIKSGADITATNEDGLTPLKLASANGHDKVVEILVKAGADVNLASEFYQESPLFSACVNGFYKTVELLVKLGANVNLANFLGNTPLCLAAREGYYEIVEFLVGAGADVDHKNDCQDTPLELASEYGHYKIVNFLLKEGAYGRPKTVNATRFSMAEWLKKRSFFKYRSGKYQVNEP